jgi:hypothetical protein
MSTSLQELTILVNLVTSLFLYLSIFSAYVKPWPKAAKLGYAVLAGTLLVESILCILYTPPPYKAELRFVESMALLIIGLSLSAFTLWKRHCWVKEHSNSVA